MSLRMAAVVGLACLSLAGCGSSSHKTATGSTSTTSASATSTSVDTSNPAAVASSVDSSLNDLNTELASIDSSPADEGDPTQ